MESVNEHGWTQKKIQHMRFITQDQLRCYNLRGASHLRISSKMGRSVIMSSIG